MDRSKFVYWALVAVMVLVMALGARLAFFSNRILKERARLAEARLGKKIAGVFPGIIRVLGALLLFLSFYLSFNLLRILPCALK